MTPEQIKRSYHVLRDQMADARKGTHEYMAISREAFDVLGVARTQMIYRNCTCTWSGWLANLRPWPGKPDTWIGECPNCHTTLACGRCKGGKRA